MQILFHRSIAILGALCALPGCFLSQESIVSHEDFLLPSHVLHEHVQGVIDRLGYDLTTGVIDEHVIYVGFQSPDGPARVCGRVIPVPEKNGAVIELRPDPGCVTPFGNIGWGYVYGYVSVSDTGEFNIYCADFIDEGRRSGVLKTISIKQVANAYERLIMEVGLKPCDLNSYS